MPGPDRMKRKRWCEKAAPLITSLRRSSSSAIASRLSRSLTWRWERRCAAWAFMTRRFTVFGRVSGIGGEETNFPREIAEAALAHVTGDKSERAYRRGDALEKRRALMAEWGAFISALPAKEPK
jgi:hypothetical protein